MRASRGTCCCGREMRGSRRGWIRTRHHLCTGCTQTQASSAVVEASTCRHARVRVRGLVRPFREPKRGYRPCYVTSLRQLRPWQRLSQIQTARTVAPPHTDAHLKRSQEQTFDKNSSWLRAPLVSSNNYTWTRMLRSQPCDGLNPTALSEPASVGSRLKRCSLGSGLFFAFFCRAGWRESHLRHGDGVKASPKAEEQ